MRSYGRFRRSGLYHVTHPTRTVATVATVLSTDCTVISVESDVALAPGGWRRPGRASVAWSAERERRWKERNVYESRYRSPVSPCAERDVTRDSCGRDLQRLTHTHTRVIQDTHTLTQSEGSRSRSDEARCKTDPKTELYNEPRAVLAATPPPPAGTGRPSLSPPRKDHTTRRPTPDSSRRSTTPLRICAPRSRSPTAPSAPILGTRDAASIACVHMRSHTFTSGRPRP